MTRASMSLLAILATGCGRVEFDYVDDLGSVTLSSAEAGFVAPNTAMIRWTPDGVVDGVPATGAWSAFDHYELWYGTDRVSVEAARAPALLWGPAEDANLGVLNQVGGARVISRTLLTGLTPATPYAASLRAVGADARVLGTSATVTFTTWPDAASAIDFFVDDFLPSSWVLVEAAGTSYQVTTAHAYSGAAAWEVTLPVLADGAVIHNGGLGAPLSPQDPATFARTFLEFAIDCPAGAASYAEVMLYDVNGHRLYFAFPDYFVCRAGYQLVQVPFAAMSVGDPQPGTLDSNLEQLWIYGLWPAGSLYFDQIRVRY